MDRISRTLLRLADGLDLLGLPRQASRISDLLKRLEDEELSGPFPPRRGIVPIDMAPAMEELRLEARRIRDALRDRIETLERVGTLAEIAMAKRRFDNMLAGQLRRSKRELERAALERTRREMRERGEDPDLVRRFLFQWPEPVSK